MQHYLLAIQQPDSPAPDPAELARIEHGLEELNDEMKAAGAWVFTGALHPPSSATVARLRDAEVLLTDGPYAEGKEQIGGLWIIAAPDLDVALGWAERAVRVTGLPIEVRPFRSSAG